MSTQENLEKMLRVMYVTAIQDADGTRAGRKDYRLRYDEVPEAYAREIMQLIDSAKREGYEQGYIECGMKWNKVAEEVLSSMKETREHIEQTTAQLEQSEESK